MSYFTALGAVCLGAASRILKSKMEKMAAAVVVGIGLLVGSTGDVQAECDPPIYDVCFHKSNWTSAGLATMIVAFDPPPAEEGQRYEIVWRGLKKIFVDGDLVETYKNVSIPGLSGVYSFSYDKFWWPSGLSVDSYESYGVEIYEGHWDYVNVGDYGQPTWVRDDWVGSAFLYNHQEAAEVRVHASLFPDFDWWTYYCTVDWQSPITPLKYGHILGTWTTYDNSRREFVYQGVHGSPRFDYRSSCSYEFSPARYVGGFAPYSINPYGPPAPRPY